MNNRYLGAALLSPLIVFLFLGGLYLKVGILVLSLLGMYEFYKVIKQKDIHAVSIVGYMICILYYFTMGNNIEYKLMFSLLVLSIFVLLCIPIVNSKYTFIDAAATLLGFIYVGVFFSFILLVYNKTYGNYLVWLIFISAWICDTCAYYVGKNFGKTKLSPQISPKKTIEGSIGGLLGSTIACTIFGIFVLSRGISIPIYNYIIIGALNGIFCQMGDLVASSIKRVVGVKDFSNLIPGHGGILDRFDSALFSAVVVFYYLSFALNL